MVNERKEAQSEIEVVMLEELVPQDHLLRKIDKYIDFSYLNRCRFRYAALWEIGLGWPGKLIRFIPSTKSKHPKN